MNTKEIIEEFARYWNEQSGVYIRPKHIDDFVKSLPKSPSTEVKGQQGEEELKQKIMEILRDGIYFSGQVNGWVVHGAVENIIKLFSSQPTPPQEGQDELIDDAINNYFHHAVWELERKDIGDIEKHNWENIKKKCQEYFKIHPH